MKLPSPHKDTATFISAASPSACATPSPVALACSGHCSVNRKYLLNPTNPPGRQEMFQTQHCRALFPPKLPTGGPAEKALATKATRRRPGQQKHHTARPARIIASSHRSCRKFPTGIPQPNQANPPCGTSSLCSPSSSWPCPGPPPVSRYKADVVSCHEA